jgi:DNA-directed RNA polymerase subunit RPC12/RpoP
MMCGHEYEEFEDEEDKERSCPSCRSNSIRHLKKKPAAKE